MALPIYAMAALRTGNNRSDQAAIKCFLMGSFASALLLFGMCLLYGLAGHTAFAQVVVALPFAANGQMLPAPVVALALVLAGRGFNVAAAPFPSNRLYVGGGQSGQPCRACARAGNGLAAEGCSMERSAGLYGRVDNAAWQFAAVMQTSLWRMLAFSFIAHLGLCTLGNCRLHSRGYAPQPHA